MSLTGRTAEGSHDEMLEALRAYPRLSNSERITFEYVMLKGVNDSDADAKRLVKLIAGIPAKINLIPFNPWPGAPYERSDWDRIEALVMADSIYASLSAEGVRRPDAEQMAGFVRFAEAAAQGDTVYVLTHTEIATPYASTADCSDWILAAVGGARAPSGAYTERGVPITAEFHRAGLHVFGFGGADAQAHVDCLWMIPELARRHAPAGGR